MFTQFVFRCQLVANCGEARDTLEAPVRSALMGASLITKPSKLNYFHSLSSIHVEVPPLHNVAIILFRMVVASTKLQSDTQAKCVSIKYRPGGETWNPPQ